MSEIKDLYENEDVLFEFNTLCDTDPKPLFIPVECIIDYDNTTDYDNLVIHEQAIDLLKEFVAKQHRFQLILLKDLNKPRNKNDIYIPYKIDFGVKIAHILADIGIPVCAVYAIHYRSTNSKEDVTFTYNTFSGILISYMFLADCSMSGSVFIGSQISRLIKIPEDVAEYVGIDNYSYYPSLREFENYLCTLTPEYRKVMERERTHEHKKTSKGELLIRNWLEKHDITYKREYTFPDCKNKNKLRFDFVIWYNDRIKCIEFDGVQHSKPIDYFGGEDTYNKQTRNDEIKNKYCKEHGIPLLRLDDNSLDDINVHLYPFVFEQKN